MQSQGILSVSNLKLLIVVNLFINFSCGLAYAEFNTTEGIIKERNNVTLWSYIMKNNSSNNDLNETTVIGNESIPILRIKRQGGGGKYEEASKMPQIKILRLWLQMFANLWSPVYIGGAHPLHRDVPKPVVFLFKQRIGDFLFPSLEDEKEAAAK